MTMTQPQDSRVPGSAEDFIDTMKRVGMDLPEEAMAAVAAEAVTSLAEVELRAQSALTFMVDKHRADPLAPVDLASVVTEMSVRDPVFGQTVVPMIVAKAIIWLEEATRP